MRGSGPTGVELSNMDAHVWVWFSVTVLRMALGLGLLVAGAQRAIDFAQSMSVIVADVDIVKPNLSWWFLCVPIIVTNDFQNLLMPQLSDVQLFLHSKDI